MLGAISVAIAKNRVTRPRSGATGGDWMRSTPEPGAGASTLFQAHHKGLPSRFSASREASANPRAGGVSTEISRKRRLSANLLDQMAIRSEIPTAAVDPAHGRPAVITCKTGMFLATGLQPWSASSALVREAGLKGRFKLVQSRPADAPGGWRRSASIQQHPACPVHSRVLAAGTISKNFLPSEGNRKLASRATDFTVRSLFQEAQACC